MSEAKRTARVYQGKTISVSYDSSRCMHAAKCMRSGLLKVFDNRKRPWVNPDGSSPQKVIDVVERCPSGALQYSYEPQSEQAETNSIQAYPDGALYLRGEISLIDAKGELIDEGKRFALCRCGQSQNKPFCDYSHHEANFKDAGGIGETKLTDELLDTEAALAITVSKDGPLLCQGNFSLRSSDNSKVVRGEKAAFCRCGGSQNKPFCDGTHKLITQGWG